MTSIDAESTSYTFATDRQDWEVGTPVLDIVNQLLAEISYNSAWVDLSGAVRLTKYEQPSISTVDHIYNSGEYSLIEDYYEITRDRFSKCNVFRVTCENPELDSPMVATSINDSADSPYSVSKMGRILYTEDVDNIPSQVALQAYADKLKYQSLQTTEAVVFGRRSYRSMSLLTWSRSSLETWLESTRRRSGEYRYPRAARWNTRQGGLYFDRLSKEREYEAEAEGVPAHQIATVGAVSTAGITLIFPGQTTASTKSTRTTKA